MDRRLSISLLLMTPLVLSGAPAEGDTASGAAPAVISAPARGVHLPPVMRKLETADSGVLQLPTTRSPQVSVTQIETASAASPPLKPEGVRSLA